jgi:hypothetical protein
VTSATVTAEFSAAAALTVIAHPAPAGDVIGGGFLPTSVSSVPSGVACTSGTTSGATRSCATLFPIGTQIVLSDTGLGVFTGCDSLDAQGDCVLTLTANRTVNAF